MAINRIIYNTSGEEIVDTNGNVTVYGIDGTANRVNKVQYGQTVLLDVTDTTAEVEDVAMGEVFYTKDGVKRTGTKSDAGTIDIDASTGTISGETLIISSGGGSISLQSKTATPSESTQTITPDSGYGGLSQVTINPIPSSYIVPVGTKTIDANGTYDVTAYASALVNVSGGASYGKYTKLKSGTVTFASRYQTTGNQLICSLDDIGFTPTFFMLSATEATIDDIYTSLTSETESNGVVIMAMFVADSGTSYTFPQKTYKRISGTTPTVSGGSTAASWTRQTNNYLYNNGTNIYYRTASNYGLPNGGEYVWLAMA